MREEGDKVGREVTTRILYILWNIYHQDFPRWLLSRATRTRARRTSEGAKRASSRLSFPSSAGISRSFSPLPSPPTHLPLFPFRRPLPERSLRSRSRRRKMAEAEMCARRASRAVHGSSERKGSSHFVHFTPHVHVHLASALSYHEQRAFILLSSVSCFLTWSLDACNAGLMSKPRLTTKSLQFMRHSNHRIFFNAALI